MSVFGRAGQVQMTFKRKFTRMTLYRGKQIGLVTTDVFLNTSVVHHIELMDGLEGKNQQYFRFFFYILTGVYFCMSKLSWRECAEDMCLRNNMLSIPDLLRHHQYCPFNVKISDGKQRSK